MTRAPDRRTARASLSGATRHVLRGSIAVTSLTFVVLAVDLAGGPSLPQAVRPALPFVLAVALCLALVIGVGAYGAPTRPAEAGDEAGDQR